MYLGPHRFLLDSHVTMICVRCVSVLSDGSCKYRLVRGYTGILVFIKPAAAQNIINCGDVIKHACPVLEVYAG